MRPVTTVTVHACRQDSATPEPPALDVNWIERLRNLPGPPNPSRKLFEEAIRAQRREARPQCASCGTAPFKSFEENQPSWRKLQKPLTAKRSWTQPRVQTAPGAASLPASSSGSRTANAAFLAGSTYPAQHASFTKSFKLLAALHHGPDMSGPFQLRRRQFEYVDKPAIRFNAVHLGCSPGLWAMSSALRAFLLPSATAAVSVCRSRARGRSVCSHFQARPR